MHTPASRTVAMIGATTLAVTGTLLLSAAPAHAAEDFDWDLRVPAMTHADKYATWVPTLTNSTGETVEDVTVSFSITVPDGKPSPLYFELEDPDGNDPAAPCDVTGDGMSVTCDVDLEPEENSYQLYLFRDRNVDLGDNDTVGIHGEAVRGDTELAGAQEQLTIEHDATMDRVEFHDVPKEVSTDRTKPDGVDWSFTITNDLGEDVTGGVIDIELSSVGPPGLELGAIEGECEEENAEHTLVTCAEIGLSDGESETIDMKLFADGTTEDLADRVTLSVDMTANTEEEPIDFAYGETYTKAVVGDGSGDDVLPVTGLSLSGYLGVGAATILLGAGILFLARRHAARQTV